MSEKMTLSSSAISQIETELKKYPDDRKQSAVMAALRIVQQDRPRPVETQDGGSRSAPRQ